MRDVTPVLNVYEPNLDFAAGNFTQKRTIESKLEHGNQTQGPNTQTFTATTVA